jgi:L-ascorbate metabolism protein UlaG (beta-lactamase superfamily)
MAGVKLTWLGHAAFRVEAPSGRRIYLDPWLENPKCPEGEREPERVDAIALTHGHDDHLGQTLELAQRFRCPVYAQVELRGWLAGQGLPADATQAMNKGGTADFDGITITMTDANHSSSVFDNGTPVYLGEAAGIVLGVEGAATIYFAGDTNVFGDMALIGRLYQPDLAVLPIGDHYTMGPKEAALAAELLGAARMLPCHYGTFPLLTGTPDACRERISACEVVAPEPGETIEV